MMNTLLSLGDLALSFKVTAVLNKSNLSVCGRGNLSSENYKCLSIIFGNKMRLK